MKAICAALALGLVLSAATPAIAQRPPEAERAEPALRTSFIRLSNGANAVLVEPVTLDPVKSRIAVLVAHPEHVNTFNYFIGRELPRYGYRVMMVNTYGPERTYDEFTAPIAAAIKALRALPGVEKVVMAGHSTGGPELTAYQDIAENGLKACQGPERIYKCRMTSAADLPKADGVMLLDTNAGAPERTIALNPAIGADPRRVDPRLDMFAPANGFDPATRGATYGAAFKTAYFAGQATRADGLIDTALGRLALIEKGQGAYKDDEPFVVPGSDLHVNGARLDLADLSVLSRTHAPHMVLKADGSSPTEIVVRVGAPTAKPDDQDGLFETTLNVTVRHYLSFEALRLEPGYALTASDIRGVQWRSTPNSAPGNMEGIRAPTLVMVATCAPHLIFGEIAFDRSPAADKSFVAVEGANHALMPCKPEYGDTTRRAFDFVDRWLSKPGRF